MYRTAEERTAARREVCKKYNSSSKFAAKMERYYHNLYIKRLAEEQAEQEKNSDAEQ